MIRVGAFGKIGLVVWSAIAIPPLPPQPGAASASFRRAEAKVARPDAPLIGLALHAIFITPPQEGNAMTAIVDVHAPPDPRQPRQSDGRGRRHARGRQHGPRGGAVGRVDRGARSGRAARRRQVPLGRQGRREGGPIGQRRDRRSRRRPRSRGPGRDRRRADRARRHREQGPARRQRDPRSQPGDGQGRGGSARAAALPLRRRGRREPAAGADDEHPQRRRPRRQSASTSRNSWSCRSARRPFPKALRCGVGDFPCAEERAAPGRAGRPRVGDEGGFAPNIASARAGARFHRQSDRARRL